MTGYGREWDDEIDVGELHALLASPNGHIEADDVKFAPELPLVGASALEDESSTAEDSAVDPDPTVTLAPDSEAAVGFLTYEEFVANPEPQAEPIVTDPDGATIIPATGITLVYGTGGAGKTTLLLDAAVHFVAGASWLDGLATPARPLRIAWVENEGPREEFRRKIERKMVGWRERVPAERFLVYSQPWAALDLRDETHREALAAFVTEADVDLLIIGPLSRLGMEGGGTPDEIRAFVALLEDIQRRAGRLVSIAVLHHENRAGQVSGAWEGVPDLLVHVQAQGNGHTRVFWQKARWSSTLHGTSAALVWGENEGYVVEDKPELSDDAIADAILLATRENGGRSWDPIERAVSGQAGRKREIRDRLLAAGTLVNTAMTTGRFKLYSADDPLLQTIRPARDGFGTDSPSALGDGQNKESVHPSPLRGTDVGTGSFSVPDEFAEHDGPEQL